MSTVKLGEDEAMGLLGPMPTLTRRETWETWMTDGHIIQITTDAIGRVIDRVRLRYDHDGGDEDPTPPQATIEPIAFEAWGPA